MWMWFRQFSVAARIRMLVSAACLMILALGAALMLRGYERELDQRKTAVKQAVEVAHSVLQWAHAQETSGQMTRSQAQATAMAQVAKIRYSGQEYFWINDMATRVVLHPIKPELNGTSALETKDPNGVYLFREFVSTVEKSGQGFVAYQWPKPGQKDPVDKTSFVKGFAPWGWVIGSGLYIDDLQAAYTQDTTIWLIACALASLTLWAAGMLTAKDIAAGMAESVRRAQAIAQGDIAAARAPHPLSNGSDEIGVLLRATAQMGEQLAEAMTEVRQSVDNVAMASQQIAAGNQDLSQRTEETSANLQHTASSMEQLSSVVDQNARTSAAAQEMASSASTAARHGGDVVQQVVATMDAIHQSARRVTEIISVIDGIAFQTNILALNAAVEAARAGEQGRGFAVVAAEVRALAQRSAQAAREIKALIHSSTEQVENGAILVKDAGQTMAGIVESVGRVATLMSEIAQATREQNQGIISIHQSMTQLDDVTQQNAALVEQSAAAAASLKDQADGLSKVVARFRLG